MEAAKQLKANLKLQGQPCSICEKPFELGEDASLCNECQASHHTQCWDQRGGCSNEQCVNAPLKKLAPEVVAPDDVKPGHKRCPSCNQQIYIEDEICMHCNAIATPDGLYHGPKENAPGAKASLVWGIVGLFVCGFILGIVAIVKSREASAIIESDPRYGGQGMATAGLVLGIVAIVLHVVVLLGRFGGGGSGF